MRLFNTPTKNKKSPDIEIIDDESGDDTDRDIDEGIETPLSADDIFVDDETFLDDDFATPPAYSSTDVVKYDPLERYLAEIRHYPMLTKEEEHRLAVAYKENGDQMAGYKIVMSNLKLVVFIAREYQRNIQNILDLVQEGNIGLLEAIKQYDPYKGIRFPSYATYWIRAYMLRYIINNLRLVKIGTTQAQRKLFYNLQKEKDRLIAAGFVPEAKLLADRLNVKESEVIEMEKRLSLSDASLDAPLRSSDQEKEQTLLGMLPDNESCVENNLIDKQFADSIRSEMEILKADMDEKERDIVDNRLFTEEPQSLNDIGARHGVSRERIRQIETKLKDKIKFHLSQRLKLDM